MTVESARDPKETLALPQKVEHWSMTTMCEKLIKIGAKVVRHGRYITFPMAEVAIPRTLFVEILRLIDGLWAGTFTAMTALQPAASRSIDRPGVRCPCQGAPSEREMTIGQGLASPNQPDKGRITTCQAGLEPDLCWGARSVTVVGNRGEPSGESRSNG